MTQERRHKARAIARARTEAPAGLPVLAAALPLAGLLLLLSCL